MRVDRSLFTVDLEIFSRFRVPYKNELRIGIRPAHLDTATGAPTSGPAEPRNLAVEPPGRRPALRPRTPTLVAVSSCAQSARPQLLSSGSEMRTIPCWPDCAGGISILPRCVSIIFRVTARPKPRPTLRVEKK